MVRTSRPPRDFFRPLAQTLAKAYKSWGAVIHVAPDSTCKFSDPPGKRLGLSASPQWLMRDSLQGTDADVKCGVCGPTLLQCMMKQDLWNNHGCNRTRSFIPAQHAPIQCIC
eukprot:4029274-Pyramimonas_sp.AAC.2